MTTVHDLAMLYGALWKTPASNSSRKTAAAQACACAGARGRRRPGSLEGRAVGGAARRAFWAAALTPSAFAADQGCLLAQWRTRVPQLSERERDRLVSIRGIQAPIAGDSIAAFDGLSSVTPAAADLSLAAI